MTEKTPCIGCSMTLANSVYLISNIKIKENKKLDLFDILSYSRFILVE